MHVRKRLAHVAALRERMLPKGSLKPPVKRTDTLKVPDVFRRPRREDARDSEELAKPSKGISFR